MSGEVKQGPRWFRDTYDFLSLPLFVRPGSVLAVGKDDTKPDYDFAVGVTLRAYELPDGGEPTTVTVPTLDGQAAFTATVRRTGNRLRAELDAPQSNWSLQAGSDEGKLVHADGAVSVLELILD